MYRGLKVGAVIVAAGKGKRMGRSINKQFLKIDNIPVLARTLLTFSNIAMIDNIVVVVDKDEVEHCRKDIINEYDINRVLDIMPGGKERQNSVLNGLKVLKDRCDIVVTHDGARPLVNTDTIVQSIRYAYMYGAAVCGAPVKDTIKILCHDDFIVGTPDRSKLYAVQTPQTFKFDLLYKAHKLAIEEGFTGTDDTVLVERMGVRVKLFSGSYENIKITCPEDIYLAEAILKHRSDREIYYMSDVERVDK